MRTMKFLLVLAVGVSPVDAAEPAADIRRVMLHDFSASASQQKSFVVGKRFAPVGEKMAQEFQSMGAGVLQTHTDAQAFVRSRPGSNFVRIPRWMRSGVPEVRQLSYSAFAAPMTGCAGGSYKPSGLLGRTAEQRRQILYPLIQQTACRAGVPLGLFDAMLMQESRYNPAAVSPKGAFGLGQLMPGTARMLGVNPYDIRSNLWGSATYLKDQIGEFGRYDLALAAYNAGPGRVRKVRRVPNITETRNYVSVILRNWLYLEKTRHIF